MGLLEYPEDECNSHHYVVLEVDETCPANRDSILSALHAENILARKYFWPGCHMMKPYRDLFPHAGLVLPNTLVTAEKVLVLPNSINISRNDIETIGAIIRTIIG